jgi:hypothetical protein
VVGVVELLVQSLADIEFETLRVEGTQFGHHPGGKAAVKDQHGATAAGLAGLRHIGKTGEQSFSPLRTEVVGGERTHQETFGGGERGQRDIVGTVRQLD